MKGGLLPGLAAIVAFGLTLPFTRIAVLDSSPWVVFLLRLVIASGAASLALLILRVPIPKSYYWLRITAVCAGVVVGFPLFTSLAMNTEAAAHGGVVLGILPLATVVCGVLINGERPSVIFWFVAIIGSTLVVAFSWLSSSGAISGGDGYLLLAIVSASIGYAVGGKLSRLMPAWQVISWALAPALPVGLIGLYFLDEPSVSSLKALFDNAQSNGSGDVFAWAGSLLYLGLISQYGGFLLWYRALAIDGVARASQLQLFQPFVTLAGAWLMLGEQIELVTVVFALLILFTIVLSRHTSARRVVVRVG
jgi:drug/metabolite transporter (DMT)-like permease